MTAAAVREAVDFREVLKAYEGREMVWRIMEQCGIFRTSFTGDAQGTAFREGQRSIGLWVLTEIVFTNGPDMFSMMSREAEEREKLRKHEQEVVDVGND